LGIRYGGVVEKEAANLTRLVGGGWQMWEMLRGRGLDDSKAVKIVGL